MPPKQAKKNQNRKNEGQKNRSNKNRKGNEDDEEEEDGKKKNYHEFCVPKWEFMEPVPKPPCFSRLDVLSRPNRHYLLHTYKEYTSHFTPCKVEKLKLLLQELYAMTPEDAEKYFAEMRSRTEAAALKKKMKAMLRLAANKQRRKEKEEKAYRKARKIITAALMYAVYNETPPIHSIRLRNLSNVILEQLCELMDVAVPDRSAQDKNSMFLLCISDWISVEIEKIFFPIRMFNTQLLNKMDWDYREMVMNEPIEFGEPLAASSGVDLPPGDPFKDADINFDDVE